MHPVKSSRQAGFTIIETLVALVILTIAMGPALILSVSAINNATRIKNNLIAANLAQEGIEVVRNIRDNNWLNGNSFDANLPAGTWLVQRDTYGGGLLPVGSNPPLKVSNGIYSYTTGTDTIFTRTVTLSEPNASELKVISEVDWVERSTQKSAKAEEHLFNWK